MTKQTLVGFGCLLILIFLIPGGVTHGQEKTPVDFQANSLQFDRQLGDDARRLIGNVRFSHEGTVMYCDSAHLFTRQNKLIAFRNIFIQVNDTVSIYGDHLRYDGNTRIAELTGNVRMTDPQMTLTTNRLIYDLNRNTANFTGGGTIVNEDNTLTSEWGFYFVDEKTFLFSDSVKLTNPDYVMTSDTLRYNTQTEIAYFYGPTTIMSDENTIFCRNGWYDTRNEIARFSRDAFLVQNEQSITGDSLFYDRNRGFGRAVGNVIVSDNERNTIITGHHAEHFENDGLSTVTQEAVLIVIAENDSLFLHADTLRAVYVEDTEQRFVFAYNQARFFRSDLQGIADSIVYNFNDSTIYLYNNPIIWSDVHQLSARRMEILTSNEEVYKALLFDAAFIASQEEDLGFNQVKGRNITGYFTNNDLTRIDVDGNGETIYFVREEDGTLIGVNKAISSRIVIFVEDRQVAGIRFFENPEANLVPYADMAEEERYLLNFEWHENIRPRSKQDIFIRN
ncbi:MAG TPA: OstA-like protein [Bacteroidales bacterium]|nr:OstA-like protein [Bacteroidales bacterium]